MSKLSESIQRQRAMDAQGHNILVVTKRNVKEDRSKPIRKQKTLGDVFNDTLQNSLVEVEVKGATHV